MPSTTALIYELYIQQNEAFFFYHFLQRHLVSRMNAHVDVLKHSHLGDHLQERTCDTHGVTRVSVLFCSQARKLEPSFPPRRSVCSGKPVVLAFPLISRVQWHFHPGYMDLRRARHGICMQFAREKLLTHVFTV